MNQKISALLFACTVSLACGLAASADNGVPAAERAGFERIREQDLRADLYFLASDGMRGRMSLDPGDEAAAEWVKSEFIKAGLEPAVKNAEGGNSYLQDVPLIEYRPNREANFLELTRGGRTKQWHAPEITGGFHDDVELSASVGFAGYAIRARGLGYDNSRGVEVKKKFGLVCEPEPQETDAHSRFNGTGNT